MTSSLAPALATKKRVIVTALDTTSADRMEALFKHHYPQPVFRHDTWAQAAHQKGRIINLLVGPLRGGFETDDFIVVTEEDLFGEKVRSNPKRKTAEAVLLDTSVMDIGDYLVHEDHGIGKFEGLETVTVEGTRHDCVVVSYHSGDKLYVPAENSNVLSRYGDADTVVSLDRLGAAGWQNRKAKLKKRLRDMAEELLKIAAARALNTAPALIPDSDLYALFAARFPYAETDDQLSATAEILEDLAKGRAMDRLLCGDVGFGKTEVAMRAAFVAASSGVQVAVIVPTTLLARQHAKTFAERFAELPLTLGHLSRFVSPRDADTTKEGLKDGTVDIVVGTHALLGSTIGFKNLGLVIVDEEHCFGVKQKEKLKALKANVHYLALSATPIPRTLQLALSGTFDLSLIATPPVDRLAIKTFVLHQDDVTLREALLRELSREGQIFYVCPRIEDLAQQAEYVQSLVPNARLAVAHGQMPAADLDTIMQDFTDYRYDVLLSTHIIESGIDIPRANTLIIHRAHLFGLAQLYQLRGRVGRSGRQGYAYFTLPAGMKVASTTQKRLEIMQTLDHLGAGFTLASHDMDLRGAGNILGEEQSGHIREVGAELYQQMLRDAIEAAKRGDAALAEDTWTPTLNVGVSVLLPPDYVKDLEVRMQLYRRASSLKTRDDVVAFKTELRDRFGPLPVEADNLLKIILLKHLCLTARITSIDVGPRGLLVAFHNNTPPNPEKIMHLTKHRPNQYKIRPDQKLFIARAPAKSVFHEVNEGVKGIV